MTVLTTGPGTSAIDARLSSTSGCLKHEMALTSAHTGYVLYCDGDRFDDRDFLRQEDAVMQFKMSLFEYEGDDSWVEDTLFAIKETLLQPRCPDHAQSGFGIERN